MNHCKEFYNTCPHTPYNWTSLYATGGAGALHGLFFRKEFLTSVPRKAALLRDDTGRRFRASERARKECLLIWKSESRVCTYRTPQAAIKSHWQKFKVTTALHLLTYLYITRKVSSHHHPLGTTKFCAATKTPTRRGHVSRDATLILDQLQNLFQYYGLLFYVSY